MSERHQTLMRTRCPDCGTVFRVTPEQLRIKLGKVRCGQCQFVFNAFDTLIADETSVEPVLQEFPVEIPETLDEPREVAEAYATLVEPEPEPEP